MFKLFFFISPLAHVLTWTNNFSFVYVRGLETVGSNDGLYWGNTQMCTCLGWKWRGTLLWWADKTTEQFKKVSCALIDTDVSDVVNYSTRSSAASCFNLSLWRHFQKFKSPTCTSFACLTLLTDGYLTWIEVNWIKLKTNLCSDSSLA